MTEDTSEIKLLAADLVRRRLLEKLTVVRDNLMADKDGLHLLSTAEFQGLMDALRQLAIVAGRLEITLSSHAPQSADTATPPTCDIARFLTVFEALSQFDAIMYATRGYGAISRDNVVALPDGAVVRVITWLKALAAS